jgi:hypothetical protein
MTAAPPVQNDKRGGRDWMSASRPNVARNNSTTRHTHVVGLTESGCAGADLYRLFVMLP